MNLFFAKTFGSLTKAYYLRQLFFGALFGALISYTAFPNSNYTIIIFAAINTLVYPYSRFLYETFIEFIVGANQFSLNITSFLMFKCLTITLCWILAIFIAPLGLACLYFISSNREKH